MDQSSVPRGRFIESLDSVRFGGKPQDYDQRVLHAKIEVMLSLLVGQPLVIPEPYSFDSLGFLDIADEVLAVWKNYRREENIRNSRVSHPFIVALRDDHPDYRRMLAYNLGRDPTKFILSGLSEITNEKDIRKSIGKLIGEGETGDFNAAKKLLDQDCRHRMEQLEDLNNYFSRDGAFTNAQAPTIPMSEYFGLIMGRRGFRDELQQDAQSLQVSIQTLMNAGIPLDNRTEVRVHGRKYLDEAPYQQILEFTDSSYNRVIADAGRAAERFHTTGGVGSSLSVVSGEVLCKFAHDELSTIVPVWGDISLIVAPTYDLKQKMETVNWQNVWEQVFKLMAGKDWIIIVKKLNDAITSSADDKRSEIEAALNELVVLATSGLDSLVITYENGAVKVIIKAAEVAGKIGKAIGTLTGSYKVGVFSLFATEIAKVSSKVEKMFVRGSAESDLLHSYRLE